MSRVGAFKLKVHDFVAVTSRCAATARALVHTL